MGLKDLFGNAKKSVQGALDKTDIDDKIVAKAGALKEKVSEEIEKRDLDEKAKDFAGKAGAAIKSGAGTVKEKIDEGLEKTDIDDKIKAKFEDVKEKVAGEKKEEGAEEKAE